MTFSFYLLNKDPVVQVSARGGTKTHQGTKAGNTITTTLIKEL